MTDPKEPLPPERLNGSPLGRLLLRAMRAGAVGAAGFLAFALVAILWQRHEAAGGFALRQGDAGFLVVAGVMLLLALWIIRAIGRELR